MASSSGALVRSARGGVCPDDATVELAAWRKISASSRTTAAADDEICNGDERQRNQRARCKNLGEGQSQRIVQRSDSECGDAVAELIERNQLPCHHRR